MGIRFEKGISKVNALLLCKWSNKKGKEFQEQWMGPHITYPLDYNKLKELKDVFSIFSEDRFIGMIQEVWLEKGNMHIGRFILDPQITGMGFGTEALRRFVEFIFENDSIKSVSLTVFDSNKNAKRVYEKLGFEIEKTIESPKRKYIMKKCR